MYTCGGAAGLSLSTGRTIPLISRVCSTRVSLMCTAGRAIGNASTHGDIRFAVKRTCSRVRFIFDERSCPGAYGIARVAMGGTGVVGATALGLTAKNCAPMAIRGIDC